MTNFRFFNPYAVGWDSRVPFSLNNFKKRFFSQQASKFHQRQLQVLNPNIIMKKIEKIHVFLKN